MTEKFDAARRESEPMGMEPDGPYQAEPFRETLEAFRLRVITKGGNVEEHYAVRRIDQLEAEVERLKEEIRVKDDTICNMRDTILVKSDDFHKERKALLSLLDEDIAEIAKLREIIRDLVGGGIRDIDPRLNYVEIQVGRRELADAREAIEGTP